MLTTDDGSATGTVGTGTSSVDIETPVIVELGITGTDPVRDDESIDWYIYVLTLSPL